jgi:predicted dehydrogenase
MTDKIRWGILSTARIAEKFAKAVAHLDDAEVIAVGSRKQATADEFADQFDIPRRHASYEALAADPDVDAIYVATPHNFHAENMLLCLEAGKPVLCEKPFTVNADEAKKVATLAREKGLFLMEAMWSRFLPIAAKARELIADGAIGDVLRVQVDFGFRSGWNPEGRLLNPDLAGGALLDVGIYVASFASMVFGGEQPDRIASMAHLGETGVDEQNAAILGYPGNRMAIISSAVRVNTPQEAWISGTEGMIRLHSRWWNGETLTLNRFGEDEETFELSMGEYNGFEYEIMEANECLREGKKESAIMPVDETIAVMETLDRIRDQWGLVYPFEEK